MKIVYWSGTGNTEKMAELIAKGIEEGGKRAEVINVSNASNDIFDNEEVIVLGCPAMGSEVLEECEFEPFIEERAEKYSGKKVALFGSYGWGTGEWMENWEERMNGYGAVITLDCLTINEAPEDNDERCLEFGKKIAAL